MDIGNIVEADDDFAYEEDIALVSFYFEKPTVFEYTRHAQEALY